MEKKKQIATFNDIVLDYTNDTFLYNSHGGATYYKNKNLGIHCDQGYIKSETEILCITSKASDPMDNKLITINPQTLTQHDVYSSPNALTAVSVNKNTLYIGAYNYNEKKAYLRVNNKEIAVGDIINILYPMENQMYMASYKSLLNNNIENYSSITVDSDIHVKRIQNNRILVL